MGDGRDQNELFAGHGGHKRGDDLIRELASLCLSAGLSNKDLAETEEFSVLTNAAEERCSLNFSGAFKSYDEADRIRALTFVLHLAHSASVKCLMLRDNGIDDACLGLSLQDFMGDKGTAKLQSMQEVDLSGNELGGGGIEAFCAISWSQLQRLVLRKTGMRAIGCKHMENAIQAGNLEALESIDLSGNQISDMGVLNLFSSFERKCPPKLREVALGDNEFGDSGLRAIVKAISTGALQHLENIDLSTRVKRKPSTAASLTPRFHFTESAMVSLVASFALGKTHNVKILDFRGLPVGRSAILKLAEVMALGNLTALEKLDLSDVLNLTNKTLVSLVSASSPGNLPHLRDLRLKGSEVQGGQSTSSGRDPCAGDGIIELARAMQSGNLKSLERLDLFGRWDETNSHLVVLLRSLSNRHMANLRVLHLCGIGLSSDCAIELATTIASGNLKNLEKLKLTGGWVVSEDALVCLAASLGKGHSLNLQKLIIRGNGSWGDENVAELARAIASGNLNSLRKVDLTSRQNVSIKSVASLVAALGNGHAVNLEQLLLIGMGVEDNSIVELAKVLASDELKSLETLRLSGNPNITNVSLKFLAAVLGKGHAVKLRELSLGGLKWGSQSVLELAKALRSGNLRSLETLEMNAVRGYAEEASMTELAAAIGAGGLIHMKRINFGNTGLGKEGVDRLAEAMGLGLLPSLQKLDFTGTRAFSRALKKLAAAEACVEALQRSLDTGKVPHMQELLVNPRRNADSTTRQDEALNLAEKYSIRRRNFSRGQEERGVSSTPGTAHEGTADEDNKPVYVPDAFVVPGMVDLEDEHSPCDYGDSEDEDEGEDDESDEEMIEADEDEIMKLTKMRS